MAVLKDLIVHGPSRFINGAKFNTINAESIGANEGIFNKLVATTLNAEEATIDNLTADNAKILGILDVQGDLHTKSWTNSNISNIGGSFYIAPTVSTVIAANNTPMSITIGGSANARTFQVSGGAFATDAVKIYNGTTTSTASWAVGSHVMVTGNIRSGTTGVDYPLGTLTGYLTGALSASGFTVGEISSPALETILGELGTSNLKSYEIKISMFEIGPKASIKPVGVMMTSYGVDKSTYIDIYGGVNVKNSSGVTIPNVRIGYLGGLGALSTVNGQTPTGWGIYTDNGYFNGVIVSNSGKIGNFTIANDLHSGTTGIGKDTNVYVSPGTNSSIAIANSPVNLNWAFTAGNKFGVTTAGDLYATGAKINGKIEATELTISSGGTTYSGVSAINANGYSIQIVEDKSAAYSGATMGDNNTYLYPILFLNGVKVETGIVYTNFIWFLDGATTGGTQGHSSNGGIVAEYGHTYRVTYSVDDTAVGEAQPSTYINVDPSKYITRIADNGITIHPETMATNSNYIHIDGNSLMVKRQVGTTAAVSTDAILASFGTTAQIGQNGSSRFLMNSNSLQAYNSSGTKYFEVNSNGLTWGSGNTAATTTQVNTAAQTATNFITNIDNDGIRIHDAHTSNNSIVINSDGMEIFQGGNSVAKYGSTSRIGPTSDVANSSHLEILPTKMTLYGINKYKEQGSLLELGDLRGIAVVETYTADGYTSYNFGPKERWAITADIPSDFTVYVNDVVQTYETDYTFIEVTSRYGNYLAVKLSRAPSAGAVVKLTYTINQSMPYTTFGTRKQNSELGRYSIAVGKECEASEKYSSAIGFDVHATGEGAFAEGFYAVASGKYSHAEGDGTVASGYASHAQNAGTIASESFQTVIGKYNASDTDALFIIGKGYNDNARSNALVARYNGDLIIAGGLTQSSDRRLKDHQSYLSTDAINFIQNLKPAHFKKDNQFHVGFYAQDVEFIDPWNCMVGEMNGFKTLSYTEIIAPLVAYCQHLEKRINDLESQNRGGKE